MELFTIEQVNLWGDYGDVLISGYCQKETPNGPALLERAGPFLPPISFPGDTIVLAEQLKIKIEAAIEGWSIPRITFRKAVFEKIVPLDWHLWDRKAKNPKRYPDGGEPENYLYDEQHSPDTASKMGVAWEMIIPEFPCVFKESFGDPDNPHKVLRPKTLLVDGTVYPGIFKSEFSRAFIISASLKELLQSQVAEWVKFYPLDVAYDPTARQRLLDQREYKDRISPHLTDEEYRTRALELCKKYSYVVPVGLDRTDLTVSRYCIVCTDTPTPKLSAKSFYSYHDMEEYILYRKRVSANPENVLLDILIYDLETGNRMKYIGNHQFIDAPTSSATKSGR